MGKNISFKTLLLYFYIFLIISIKYISMWTYLFEKKFIIPKSFVFFTIVLFCILFMFLKSDKRTLRNIFLLLLLTVIVYFINPNFDFIVAVMSAILFSLEKDGDRKFLDAYFKSSAFYFLLTLLLYFIGVLPANDSLRVVESGIIVRYSLGFAGMNTLFMCLLPILLSYVILNKKKVEQNKIFYLFIMMILVVVFYKFTLCRTGLLSSIILVLLLFFENKISSKILSFIIRYSYIIFTTMSVIIALFYEKLPLISTILTDRPFYWNIYLNKLNINLFGNNIISKVALDNTYLTYLLIDGSIIFLIYLFFSYFSEKKIRNNNYILISFLVFYIYGMFENNYSFQYNFVLTLQLIYFINVKKSQLLICEEKE